MNGIPTETDLFQTLGLARELEANSSSSELQLEDFLNLMVTELTHQDPFKPMDNTQLATQISQFATVSGVQELNDSFSDLSSSLLSDQALQATTLVGHDVLVPGNTGYLNSGGTISGVIGIEQPANNLIVRVTDPSGALVREIPMGAQPMGEVRFNWDGLMDNGSFAPPGQYQISASAVIDDQTVSPYLLMEAAVESVSIGQPGQPLMLNLAGVGQVPFNDVAEIR